MNILRINTGVKSGFMLISLCIIGPTGCGGDSVQDPFQAETNNVPIARAEVDNAAVLTGANSAKLDGLGSTDPDGDIITYNWSVVSAPEKSNARVSEPTASDPVFTPDLPGDYSIQLVVNDTISSSSPAFISVKGQKLAVYGDDSGTELQDYLAKRGIPVDNFSGKPDSVFPKTENDFIAELIHAKTDVKADYLSLILAINDYSMILFGDSLTSASALALFDAADLAGVNMLGIGTYDNDFPLGVILSQDNRFGLSYDDDYLISPMEIEASMGIGHPVFTGMDTTGIIHLENINAKERDEQVYYTEPSDLASPADWKEIAVMGPGMQYRQAPAIVEFSTPSGTTVILDGSANTYDWYDYWTQTRWDMLYREVIYLALKHEEK